MRVGIISAVWLWMGAALAQMSPYYVTKGTSGPGTTYVMQGGAQQFNYAWAAPGEMPIVIGNFGSGVRVREACGQPTTGMPQQGDEYQTNGTPTGFTNLWDSGDPAGTTAYDAAFNGTNIFMVHWLGATDGQVFRYDNNYGNGQFMFNARNGDLGITYDPVNNSIWVSNWNDGLVTQYSLTGTQLSQFATGGNSVGGLAYDPADGTLWMCINSAGILAQYSRAGALLNSYPRPDYVLGGEMLAVGSSAVTINPTTTTLSPGIVISGTPSDMFTSNDVYYVLRPGVVLSSSQNPIVLVLSGTAPGSTASSLNMVVESHANQANIRQTIDSYNFSTASYDLLNQAVLPLADVSNNLPIASPNNHIGPGNEVRTRLSYRAVGPILSYPWRVSIDEATWRYTP